MTKAVDGNLSGNGSIFDSVSGHRPDISCVESNVVLFFVGLAENLQRSRYIEQQRSGRKNHVHRNSALPRRAHDASFDAGPASACSTVAIRAKR
jgi:hypothetical protein